MREEIIGDCRLILGDCKDFIKLEPNLRFDALLTDPPYGIGEAAGKNKSRGNLAIAKDYGNLEWDNETPGEWLLNDLRARADRQIIFGGNYFYLPPSSCWLVWDKKITGDFADCELAWTNLNKAVRKIEWAWNGFIRKGEMDKTIDQSRVHPTQKPVGVMEWCLSHLPADTQTVFDPFMGSGTTGVACVHKGKSFTGIEREQQYFDIACRRIEEAYKQPDLFVPAPEKIKQETFL